jgi:pyruvate/2-oxoglutarate dehydrogenase complex dihydrolipoamide acyltransferase (E2) component
MIPVKLPELGDDITRAVVACWHYQPGDKVSKDDDLVELVTDKAVFNVAAPVSGTLAGILVPEGQNAPIGAVLAEIEEVSP